MDRRITEPTNIPRFKTMAQFRDSVRQILDGIISVYSLELWNIGSHQ